MKGRFNLFQSAMLRWRGLYPYNAVHVAELPGTLDAERLEAAIAAHLAATGITRLALDTKRRRYEYAGGAVRVTLPVHDANGEAMSVLEREMERHLNTPFGPAPGESAYEPLRFFAVRNGGSFHVGVAYDHVIAGGDSIVALLQDIAARYDGTYPDNEPAPDLYPRPYGRLFRRNLLAFYLGFHFLPWMLLRSRRLVRPRYPHGESRYNAFTSIEFTPGIHAAVRRTAKQWGVTVNDMLLAMLLDAIAAQIPDRLAAPRRREVGIACVINLRGELEPGTREVFGQFLSSFFVSHLVPPGTSLETLAHAVHEQTQRMRRRKLYLQTLCLLGGVGVAWRFMTPEQHKQMYAKAYPVWGGVSALNVEAMWKAGVGEAPILHYLRAISTGPFSPLVLAPASVGDGMHIGVSWRPSAFTRAEIDRITAAMQSCARKLGSC